MDAAMEEDASMQEKPAMPDHSRAYEGLKRPIDPSGSEPFLPSYLRDMPYAEEVKYSRERKAQKDKATERLALQNQRRKQNNSATANTERDTSVEQILGNDTSVPPLPSRWQPHATDYLRNVRLEQNPFKLYNDAEGSARAEYCVSNLCGMYYYEVTILDCPTESTSFSMGLGTRDADISKPPSHAPDTWAIHADDAVEHGHNPGKIWGPRLVKGDTYGCGQILREKTIFFTKNGQRHDRCFTDVTKRELYPILHFYSNAGLEVSTNWGQSPFVFDIDAVAKEQRQKVQDKVTKEPTYPEDIRTAREPLLEKAVLQVLQRDGYAEPARLFAEELKAQKKSLDPNVRDLWSDPVARKGVVQRQNIRLAMLSGDVDKALELTNEAYPHVLQGNEQVHFRLRCQKFIEMVRISAQLREPTSRGTNGDQLGRMDQEDISLKMHLSKSDQAMLAYGRSIQADYSSDIRREYVEMLEDIWSLMAYENPAKAPRSKHLMAMEQREAVWNALNSAILVSLGDEKMSQIEVLLGQTSVLLRKCRSDGGDCCFISLEEQTRQVHARLAGRQE